MANELHTTDERRSSSIWIKIDLDGKSTVLIPPEQCETEARARALLAFLVPKLEEVTKAVEQFMCATETDYGSRWL